MDNKSLWSAMTPSEQLNGRGKENEAKARRKKREKRTGGKKRKETQGNKKESLFCSME